MRLVRLIPYAISQIREAGGIPPGTTKLIKILYLIDVEYYRHYGKTLTGARWVFYHYGPYPFGIEKELSALHLDLTQEEVQTRSGHKAVVFDLDRGVWVDIDDELTFAEKALVDRTIRRWALAELPEMLDYVYFHTEPMEKAKRGTDLDFTRIPWPPQRKPPLMLPNPPVELLTRLREHVAQKSAVDSRRQRLTPPPRYDKLYWQALKARDEEDRLYLREGQLTIGESVKHSISEATE